MQAPPTPSLCMGDNNKTCVCLLQRVVVPDDLSQICPHEGFRPSHHERDVVRAPIDQPTNKRIRRRLGRRFGSAVEVDLAMVGLLDQCATVVSSQLLIPLLQ